MPSSYFSKPLTYLDPALFTTDNRLHTNVKYQILDEAYLAMYHQKLRDPENWLYVWLTGSGISYQWEADRGNGDLDVQLGIDYQGFLKDNPEYHDVDPYSMSDIINKFLKERLDPQLSRTNFNGKFFEVTFFWNSLVTGNEIDYIKPYAAYDLIKDTWVVEPPELPNDPSTLYPSTWGMSVEIDDLTSQRLLQSHIELTREEAKGGPNEVTFKAMHNIVDSQAQALYDDIHLGRKEAFTTGGHGYYDWHNFRWQSAKASGTIDRLKTIINCHDTEQDSKDLELYGGPIKDAHEVLEEAMTRNINGN